MNRRKSGMILFWLGIAIVFVSHALNWIQSPIYRVQTAEELRGTAHAIGGLLFYVRTLGWNGLALSLIGVLIFTSKKGSYFWLLGTIPMAALGLAVFLWEPSSYVPQLFGIGGAIILVSYFAILWLWTRTYQAYEGIARTGRIVQLLGYSFLVITGCLLCLYFGYPAQLALADLPIPMIPNSLSINISLSLGMLLIVFGEYLIARKQL
jgi:hypothetical protein